MWICLNDCFLSIVAKDCARDELMVRARRRGDIEKIFPTAAVTRYTKSDYLYRAPVKRAEIKTALAGEVDRVSYANFKDSVVDLPLHNAYLRCWTAMATLQPVRPYSGRASSAFFGLDFGDDLDPPPPKQFAQVVRVRKPKAKKPAGKTTTGGSR
jgi:hypothetical protein